MHQSLIKLAQTNDVWVKRVIGRPGDVLEFKDGHVWRNGEQLQEPYTKDTKMNYTRSTPVTVPEGHVFVMGITEIILVIVVSLALFQLITS